MKTSGNGKDIKKFFIETAIVAVIYFATLLPSQYLLNLLPGTELRLSAFIPVVAGILCGWPAALGVAVGNIACDIITYGTSTGALIFVGSLLNGACAIVSYYLFKFTDYYIHKIENKTFEYKYVHDINSLAAYFLTVIISQTLLATGISVVLVKYSGIDFTLNFVIVLLSNIEICMLLGLPAIIYSPRIFKENRNITHTLKFRTFASLMMTSILLSLIIAGLMMFLYKQFVNSSSELTLEIISYVFKVNGLLIMILTIMFCVLETAIEKYLTSPLEQISDMLRNDDDTKNNEIDVLSKHIDFKVKDSDKIDGNEYTLYVGLTSKDGRYGYTPEYARCVISEICLSYVKGYFVKEESEGGYRGESAESKERVLVFEIFGATDNQIEHICKDIKIELNQESILIEKNKVTRWYY